MDRPKPSRAALFWRGGAVRLIRLYQLTLSSLVGSQCRHLPSCSAFASEAISRHGLWAGGAMGFARVCRCQPFGTAGFDPVPARLPAHARWWLPWRYGRWRGPLPDLPWAERGSGAEAAANHGQGDGAGVGDVEAADRPRQVEPGDDVAVFAGQPAQALSLAAEDERERPA